MDKPLLRKNSANEDVKLFLTPANHSTSYLAFFIFPYKYIKKFNAKVQEYKSKGQQMKFELNYSLLPPLLKLRDSLDDDIQSQTDRMEQIFFKQRTLGNKISLYQLAYKTIPVQIKTILSTLFVDVFFRLLYSFFMGKTIKSLSIYYYENKHENVDLQRLQELKIETIYSTTLMIVIILSYIYFERLYYSISFQTGVKLKLIFIGLLYRKLHRVSLSALNEVSLGRFINIIQGDLTQVERGVKSLSTVVVAPFVLMVGAVMLWNYFGVWSILAIMIMLIYMPLQNMVVRLSEQPKKFQNKMGDERLRLVGEIIEQIRALKQYTCEQLFKELALSIRKQEEEGFLKVASIQSISQSLSSTSVYISLLVTVFFYTQFQEEELTAAKVFSSILILQIIKQWCVLEFTEGLLFIVNFKITQERILDILMLEEIVIKQPKGENLKESQEIEMYEGQFNSMEDEEDDIQKSYIKCEEYFGFWSKDKYKMKQAVLKGINLEIQDTKFKSNLNCIIGRIGSGKTSLLLSLLHEIPYNNGLIKIKGKIAYVEQEPYVFAGSIRENILFGLDYNEGQYQKVLKSSSFLMDLNEMPDGDSTFVGEKGVKLSGGQRARLSFARALYSDSDIYLLDDPLSAVDSKVARVMFNKGIKEMLKNKIVLLITHHIHFAMESDYLIVLHEGIIRSQGEPQEVIETLGSEFQQYIENLPSVRHSLSIKEDGISLKTQELLKQLQGVIGNAESVDDEKIVEEAKDDREDQPEINRADIQSPQIINISKIQQQALQKDIQNDVTFKTFLNYFSFGGGNFIVLRIYLLFVCDTCFIISINRVLGYWAKENEDIAKQDIQEFNHQFYLKLEIFLLFFVQMISYQKSYRIKLKTFEIATNLYSKMLNTLVRAKTSYFDETPSGYIISRFSSDLTYIQGWLAQNLELNFEGFTSLTITMLTVCYVNPVIFIPAAVFFYILYRLKNFFQPYMSYTRNCDNVTRGPLNTEVAQSLNGLIVIRAYNKAHLYIDKFQELIYQNARGMLGFSRCNTFLSLLVDLNLFVLIAVGCFLLVYIAQNFGESRDPGQLAFSFLLLVSLGDNFSVVFRSFFIIEINMSFFERILTITQVESEAPLVTDFEVWPNQGRIDFKNVFVRYGDNNEQLYALRGVSFSITPGQRIGIAGRTGAGKSTIIQVLFRMVELEIRNEKEGIFIDNQNIKNFGLHFLRSRISIIPQSPVVFQGTIRRNLDPLNQNSDDRLWITLDEVGLKKHVQQLEKGLLTDMTQSSSVFSVGQKQLICLARAMLLNNRIIVFDEATSNVDLKTDQFIQKKIKEKFQNCTLVTIAHRLETIADYDKILVLDQVNINNFNKKGAVVEFDHPFKLLVKNQSDQEITKTDGFFAQMVGFTGKQAGKKIFNISQRAYMKKFTY